MKNKFTSYIKKLFKTRMFLCFLFSYLFIVTIALLVIFVKTPLRTDGVYQYWENGQLVGEIILYQNNTLEYRLASADSSQTESEIRYQEQMKTWNIMINDEYKSYEEKNYKYVSNQQIVFYNESGSSYVQFFKIDNNLYSKYLLKNGEQKCYTKI